MDYAELISIKLAQNNPILEIMQCKVYIWNNIDTLPETEITQCLDFQSRFCHSSVFSFKETFFELHPNHLLALLSHFLLVHLFFYQIPCKVWFWSSLSPIFSSLKSFQILWLRVPGPFAGYVYSLQLGIIYDSINGNHAL